MKFATITLYASIFFAVTKAHWIYDRIVYENKWTEIYEYVREVDPKDNVTDGYALWYPLLDPDSTDIRCGRNATLGWAHPKTAVLKAGDKMGFIVGENRINNNGRMFHPGFASAWLSKASGDDLDSYLGDGDWFKIMVVTNRTEQSVDLSDPTIPHYRPDEIWGAYNAQSWNFTIPATTPPGKYLVRFEFIVPLGTDAQFYINCAHIEIQNSGSIGTPNPLVKIPGVYKRGQSDVYFYPGNWEGSGKTIDDFVPPYPPVWQG